MKRAYTKTALVATTITLFLSACGGGGGDKKPPTTPPASLNTVVTCTEGYSPLIKNDKITALKDNTEVVIRHSEDGTREACVKSGEAKID